VAIVPENVTTRGEAPDVGEAKNIGVGVFGELVLPSGVKGPDETGEGLIDGDPLTGRVGICMPWGTTEIDPPL